LYGFCRSCIHTSQLKKLKANRLKIQNKKLNNNSIDTIENIDGLDYHYRKHRVRALSMFLQLYSAGHPILQLFSATLNQLFDLRQPRLRLGGKAWFITLNVAYFEAELSVSRYRRR